MGIARVMLLGRLYVPEPAHPTRTFFTHLVDLGDEMFDQQRFADATHWYTIACERAPAAQDEQQLDVYLAFLTRARDAERDALAPGVVARRYRSACGVVMGIWKYAPPAAGETTR